MSRRKRLGVFWQVSKFKTQRSRRTDAECAEKTGGN
jgi:hypothetical protein